jgi:hypothetical protein
VNQGVAWASLAVPDGRDVLAAAREEGDREMVLWRPSRHGARGKDREAPGPWEVPEEWMRPCRARWGHDLSMGRTLEKPGPALFTRVSAWKGYSPKSGKLAAFRWMASLRFGGRFFAHDSLAFHHFAQPFFSWRLDAPLAF